MRIVGPRAEPMGRPMMPARRKMATVESTVATIHTTVWMRFTGTPSSAARSALSALARMAMPKSVYRGRTARGRR